MLNERIDRYHVKDGNGNCVPKREETRHVQSVICLADYDTEKMYSAVCRHFEALKVKDDLFEGIRVLIKPNLIAAKKPETVATTHPSVVEAVLRWLTEQGVKDIVVADSPGGMYTPEFLRNVYRVTGLDEVVKKYENARLNSDVGFTSVVCPDGFANHTFNIINPIVEADYVINLAKLKSHAMTGMSAGIKNMFGSIPGLQKPQLHYRWPEQQAFCNMLVELANVTSPEIVLIDAVEAMEGDGPTGGTPVHAGYTMCARDFFTQDFYACRTMHLEPESIAMLKNAMDKGLVTPDKTVWVGDPLPMDLRPFEVPKTRELDFSSMVPGFLSKPVTRILSGVLKSYPVLNRDKCVGCMKCAQVCPAQIIKQKDGKPKFTKKGCISCFCCQEMCPQNAIDVKKAL